jgi:hypothetical protein
MRKPVAIFAVLMVCVVCRTSPAEDPAVAAAYGAGVHGYYAGNFQQSHDTLSRVVSIGTDDPRVYYFRGLAALRLGRRDEAIADFSEGVDLEAAAWNGCRALIGCCWNGREPEPGWPLLRPSDPRGERCGQPGPT